MTSWDEIESANRRSRNVRVLRIAIVIGIAYYAWNPLSEYVQRLLPQTKDPEEQETQALLGLSEAEVSDQPVTSQLKAKSKEATFRDDRHPGGDMLPVEQTEASKHAQPLKSTKASSQLEEKEPIAISGGVPDARKEDAMPFTEPAWAEPEDQDFSVAELEDTLEAIASLQEEVEEQVSLAEIGGEEWESISTLVERSKSTRKTDQAIQLAERALHLLAELRPEFQWRQLKFDLSNVPGSERASVLVQFWSAYPKHAKVNEAEKLLRDIDSLTWLHKAEDSNTQSMVTDGGIAEAWMAIADAWQLLSDDDLSKLASFKARHAISRMTTVERAIESGIELVAASDSPIADTEAWLESLASMARSVGIPLLQRSYLAELAGWAQIRGYKGLSERLTVSACDSQGLSGTYARDYLPQYRRCHVLSFTGEFDSILGVAERLKKYNGSRGYDPLYANAGCFAFAALAAAKQNKVVDYSKAMLLAESQLAGLNHMSAPTYHYLERLAEADLAMGRLDAANIIANQLPDPSTRASLLFRILLLDKERLCAADLRDVFGQHGTDRWGARALAMYVESQMSSEADPFKLLNWIESLDSKALKAAGYAGFARAAFHRSNRSNQLPAIETSFESSAVHIALTQTNVVDPSQIMQRAERELPLLQDPLAAAYACAQMADIYYRQDRIASYERMIGNTRQHAFQLWQEAWQDRPKPIASFDGSYQLKYSKPEIRRANQRAIGDLAEYYFNLARLQLQLGDAPGALESILMLIRTAGYQTEVKGATRVAYLVSESLLAGDALEKSDLPVFGIGPRLLNVPTTTSSIYSRALIAAWSNQLAQLQQCVEELEDSPHKGNAQVARVYGELAVLHAKRGEVPAYVAARRKAASLIENRSDLGSLKLILAEADALAGDYQLAEDGLVSGRLAWYGTVSRPRSVLAQQLAADGEFKRAELHAKQIGDSGSFESMRAWSAIATSKMVQLSDSSNEESLDELLRWVESLPQPEIRIAARCGLTCREQKRRQSQSLEPARRTTSAE